MITLLIPIHEMMKWVSKIDRIFFIILRICRSQSDDLVHEMLNT